MANFKIFLFIISITSYSSCDDNQNQNIDEVITQPNDIAQPSFSKVSNIINQSPQGDYIMVLAHRAGFEVTPENSISALENSYKIGVDIAEIDVRLSKDGILMVIHDTTLDRTTNGIGLVEDYTVEELKEFRLLNPNGSLSNENIPTLEEALEYSKDKIHLFIDKADDYFDLVYEDMLQTGTVNQTLMGGVMTISEYKFKYPEIWNKINYVPRAGLGQSEEYITNFENEINPIAYFPSCNLISSNNDVFSKIKEMNKWIFSTTLDLPGSVNCSEQLLNSESIWNWEIQKGTDGIFTDKPKELIEYLKQLELHNNE